MKAAACICIGLVVVELLVLVFVHPGDNRCPGWTFHPGQRSAASLWLLAGMFTVLPALWISNVALRWDHHYARKTYDSLTHGAPAQLLNLNQLMLIVAIGWCLFCAIPLGLMLGQCTPLYDYLNAFR